MAPPRDRAAVVAQLREHLARVAPVRAQPAASGLPTGFDGLDEHLGGWPRPGLAEIAGPVGSGRLGVVLPALQELTRSGRLACVVDPVGWLNPPGLPGVVLDHLVLVRPGGTRAGWAAEQLARCGGFPLVVVLDAGSLGRAGRRLQHAAEAGDAAVCLLSESPDPALPAAVRLQVSGPGRVRITRGARRRPGLEVRLRPASPSLRDSSLRDRSSRWPLAFGH